MRLARGVLLGHGMPLAIPLALALATSAPPAAAHPDPGATPPHQAPASTASASLPAAAPGSPSPSARTGEASQAAVSAAREGAARLLGQAIAGEPSVDDVQRAAAGRAAPSRGEAEGWRRRARLEALVPRLSASYRHDERNYRVVGLTGSSEVDYLRESPGDSATVRVDWDLAGLVLGRSELAAVSAAERAEATRRAAVERATRLYHRRLQAKVELLAAPPDGAAGRAKAELELSLLTAELQALTGLYGREGGAP